MIFMGEYKFDNRHIEIGQQDFDNSTVPVKENGIITSCKMYEDEYGDFYFDYQGKFIYFRDIN